MWSFEVVMENGLKLEKNETTLFHKGIIRGIEGSDGKHNGKSVVKKKEAVLSKRDGQYLGALVISKMEKWRQRETFWYQEVWWRIKAGRRLVAQSKDW